MKRIRKPAPRPPFREDPGGTDLCRFVESNAPVPWHVAYGLLRDWARCLEGRRRATSLTAFRVDPGLRGRHLDHPDLPEELSPRVALGRAAQGLLGMRAADKSWPRDLPLSAEPALEACLKPRARHPIPALLALDPERQELPPRLAGLALALALPVLALGWMTFTSRPERAASDDAGWFLLEHLFGVLALCGTASSAGALALRGSLAFTLTGVALRDRRGRRASRLCCLVRSLVPWLPALVLLGVAGGLKDGALGPFVPAALLGLFLLGVIAQVVSAQRDPARSLVDRIVGTSLVPR